MSVLDTIVLLSIIPVAIFIAIIIVAIADGESPLFWFNEDTNVKLTFKQFMTYYNLNPGRYNLRSDYIEYISEEGGYGYNYRNGYYFQRIGFKSFAGIILYKLFYNKLERSEQKEIERDNLVSYLKCVQKDIDKLRSKANKEASQAKEIMEEIDK